VFASEIYDQNQIAIKEGRTPLNLQSILIGNGITDISTWVVEQSHPAYDSIHVSFNRLYAGRYEVECGTASLDVPFQTISSCVRMKTAVRSIVSSKIVKTSNV
jgi:hypothetical protein